jgi:hypothetical protein
MPLLVRQRFNSEDQPGFYPVADSLGCVILQGALEQLPLRRNNLEQMKPAILLVAPPVRHADRRTPAARGRLPEPAMHASYDGSRYLAEWVWRPGSLEISRSPRARRGGWDEFEMRLPWSRRCLFVPERINKPGNPWSMIPSGRPPIGRGLRRHP